MGKFRKLLESGDLSQLIGEFETLHLECKRQPYQLTSDSQKIELVKDVAALANAEGGAILIGYCTVRDPAHGQDRISEYRPLRREILDPEQYRQIIQDWTWPPLSNIEVAWFASGSQPGEGIYAIFVPRATDADRPVLVSRTLVDGERRREIIFGYCERGQSRVFHHSVQRLQALLRDGNRLDQELREGMQSIQASLESLRATRELPPPSRDPEELLRRIAEAIQSVGLYGLPTYCLTANPKRVLEIHELFEPRSSPFVQLLEHPPKVRRSGFDITSGERAQIVEGRLRRCVIEGFNLLELHRDGTLIFVASGDREGLLWGSRNEFNSSSRINQLFLVETVYSFCRLAYEIYAGKVEDKDSIDLALQVQNLSKTPPVELEPGPLSLDGFPSFRSQKAPANSGIVEITVQPRQESAARAAFRLLAQVYAWFGYDQGAIPYSEDGQTISEERLKGVR